jgi:hypothetical protein
MKKRGKDKHKRFEVLNVQLNEYHVNPETNRVEINLMIDMVNDENKVILAHNGEVVPSDKLVRGYFGENKTRILSEIPCEINDHSLSEIKKLQKYDRIVAIDTNSSFCEKIKINLGIAYHIVGQIHETAIEWELTWINQYFVLVGESEKIENRNWRQLIEFILRHRNYYPQQRIGLVVDSDLGNLKDYNKRTKPLCDNFYLPDNFELIFASDKAADSILNSAIKICHNTSIKVLPDLVEAFKEALNSHKKSS